MGHKKDLGNGLPSPENPLLLWLRDEGYDTDRRPVQRCWKQNKTQRLPTTACNDGFLYLQEKCLVGADFSGLDLKFALFEKCDLSSARFDACNLFKAVFRDCTLYNATFNGAVLVDVDFTGSFLFGIRLEGAKLYGAGGDSTVRSILARERDDQGRLVYRGTAGRSDWSAARPRSIPLGSPNDSGAPGVFACEHEVIERVPLAWFDQMSRAHEGSEDYRLRSKPHENFPKTTVAVWPIDSMREIFRSFRECFEQQGKMRLAAKYRFWEGAYTIACDLKGWGPSSHVAETLLHPDDSQRKPWMIWFHLHGSSICGWLLHAGILLLALALTSTLLYLLVYWLAPLGPPRVLVPLLILVLGVAGAISFTHPRSRPAVLALLALVNHVTSGHGESPTRAVSSCVLWIVLFALLFQLPQAGVSVPSQSQLGQPVLSFYYSAVTATTLGLGDVHPATPLAEYFTVVEVIGAIGLTGILIATLVQRFRG